MPLQPRSSASTVGAGAARLCRATASAIASMCAGVVPQQPPTMFSQPFAANSPSTRAISSRRLVEAAERVRQAGVRIAADDRRGAMFESSSIYGRICSGPSAQLMPTLSSGVRDRVPEGLDRLRRERARRPSKTVTEAITGNAAPVSSKYFSMANRHALRISVSNAVSASSRSTPPSTSAATCS